MRARLAALFVSILVGSLLAVATVAGADPIPDPGSAPECTAHCDCPQGSFCYYGKCLADPKTPVYCATKPGCPPGRLAFNPDGTKGTCAEDPAYVCGDACDCGPAHCCRYDATVGHNVCVKDTADPWNPGGTAIGPACRRGVDATYCCGDPICHAGRFAYGDEDVLSFRCHDRTTGTTSSMCSGKDCYGTGCNCDPGESCLDVASGSGGIASTCFLLGGGACVSNAVAEAVYGASPADLVPCCGQGCLAGQRCELGAAGGCGSVGYQRLVGTCGSCGNGTCDTGEFPATCAADCACGDGACAPSEVGMCAADCGTCGNGTCDPGESSAGCPADCGGAGDGRCALDEPWSKPSDCGCPDAAYYPQVYEVCGDGVCSASDPLTPETSKTCPQDCGTSLLTVYVAGVDANAAPGPSLATGSDTTWRYVAKNGNGALTGVALADDRAGVAPALVGGDTTNPGVLDTGETWTWEATAPVLAGPRTVHATLTATSGATAVTSTDGASYVGVEPSLLAVDTAQLAVLRRLGGATGRYARYFAPDLARDAIVVGGHLVVVGQTVATDFPVTDGSTQGTSTWDAFVAVLGADGSVDAATLLGPGTARAVAADAAGNLYVAGSFGLVKLDADLARAWSRAFDAEGLYGVAVDESGRAHVVGGPGVGLARVATDGASVEATVPLAGTGRAIALATDGTAYVAGSMGVVKVGPDGTVAWTKGLGGTPAGIALRGASLYVVGETSTTGHATGGAADAALGGATDAFLSVVGTGGGVTYWTYLGGGAGDAATDVAVDAFGLVHVVGATGSGDFPVTPDAADRLLQGHGDAFVAKVRPAGAGAADLLYATLLGGTDPGTTVYGGVSVDLPYLVPDRALGVALGAGSVTWVVGETGAPDLGFVGPTSALGFTDALVAGLVIPNRPPIADAGSDATIIAGETATLDGRASRDVDGTVMAWRWRLDDGADLDGSVVQVVPVAGFHRETLTVTDDRGGTATDTVVVIARSPADAVRALMADLRAMGLPSTTTRGLLAKLQDAATALDRGSVRAAIGKLTDFINQAMALRGRQLTASQADQLVAAARRILAVLR